MPLAELEGSKLENFDLAFTLQDGRALLSMPKPASLSGGSLDISGGTIDLTDAVAPRLSMPKDKQIVTKW